MMNLNAVSQVLRRFCHGREASGTMPISKILTARAAVIVIPAFRMLEATNNGLFIGEKMVTPRTVECGRWRLRVCSKRCRPFLHRLWPATSSSQRLHDIGKLVQKSLHTRELFPRLTSSNKAEGWSAARRRLSVCAVQVLDASLPRLTLQQGCGRALSRESACETAQSGQRKVIRRV